MNNNTIIFIEFILESFGFSVILAYSYALYLKYKPINATFKSIAISKPFFIAIAIGVIPGMLITSLLSYNLTETGYIVRIPELLGILITIILIFRMLQKMIIRKLNWNIAIVCMTLVFCVLKLKLHSV